MTLRTTRSSFSVAVSATALVASCTLLGDREIHQCSTDAECPSQRCDVANSLCLAIVPQPEAGLPDVAPVEGGVDAGGCTSHAQCAKGEACFDGKCTAVGNATSPCSSLPAKEQKEIYQNPKAVLVGVYFFGGTGGPEAGAADLALTKINAELATRNDPVRIGAFYCGKSERLDNAGSARAAVEALRKLGARAMIGQLDASELTNDKFREAVKATGLAVFSTLGNLSSLQEPTPDDVRYRFIVDQLQSQIGATNPYNDAILEAEARMTRIKLGVRPSPMVVRFLVAKGPDGVATPEAKALYEKAVASPALAGDFDVGQVLVESAFDKIDPTPDTAAPAAIESTKPHIVIAIGGDEVKRVITSVETNQNFGATERPVWVVGPRQKIINFSVSQFNALSFTRRFIGVDFDGDSAKSVALASAAVVASTHTFDALYDGMFGLTFGIVRAHQTKAGATPANLTGPEILKGFDEALQPAGSPVVVEIPAQFDPGVDALRKNDVLHVKGLTGPMVFSTGAKRGARVATTATNPYFCFKTGSQSVSLYVSKDDLKAPSVCASPP